MLTFSALLLMKEDIRASGMHESEEDLRRDISTSTSGYLVEILGFTSELLSNETASTDRTANENKVNVSTNSKLDFVKDYNNKKMLLSNIAINPKEMQIERIPSIAHKYKLKINNMTFENASYPLRSNIVNESVIIKETLEEIMNLNVSLIKSDTIDSQSTLAYMNIIRRDENSTPINEFGLNLNSTSKNYVASSAFRRDFELDSIRSFYTKNTQGRNDTKTPTKPEFQGGKIQDKAAPTKKVHKDVSIDRESSNFQRRDFVLDSLKSIYIKDIRTDFNLTTERNVNMSLYKLPFNFKNEDEESASENVTIKEKSSVAPNISKGTQKLNAVLFQIPQVMSKINVNLRNSSSAHFTLNHGRRALNINSLKSEYTRHLPENVNLSAVNDNGTVFKKYMTLAMEDSKIKHNNLLERLLQSKSNINGTKAQEITTVNREDLNRRKQPHEDSENLKSVIDLGVFKKLMEAARNNNRVRKIKFETSTVDTTVNFGEDSSETKFVNVWRETYLKPKAKLSQKTGALINLINKLNWKLAKSDKTAMENVYGPAANQSFVPQFRRLWDFFWEWYYDPESKFRLFVILHCSYLSKLLYIESSVI